MMEWNYQGVTFGLWACDAAVGPLIWGGGTSKCPLGGIHGGGGLPSALPPTRANS